MPNSRTRLAVVACAVCGTVESTVASGDVTSSAAPPLTIAAATFTAPPGTSLDDPQGIVPADGTIDVSNTADNVVASIVGNATATIAGSYEGTGESGDGAPATAATLDQPTALARDEAGDVFIADTSNNVVREVTPGGTISTVAGNGTAGYKGDNGPAGRAELSSPTGLAVDALGNLYVADSGNNVIRRVSTNGIITTVAGDVAADQASGGLGG